jgi:hypothetical protein
MTIAIDFVQGVMFGFEFFQDDEGSYLIADLLIVRVLFTKED